MKECRECEHFEECEEKVSTDETADWYIKGSAREPKERRDAFKNRSKPTQGPISVEESAESR